MYIGYRVQYHLYIPGIQSNMTENQKVTDEITVSNYVLYKSQRPTESCTKSLLPTMHQEVVKT